MTRRVLITGGAAGIGATLARRFAEAGDRVIVTDRDAEACETFQRETGLLAHAVSVTDEAAFDAALASVDTDLGGIDIVCANAGIGGPAAAIEDQTLEGWRDTLAVNLDGAFLACRWAARVMKPHRSGVILLTSSTSGLFGHPTRAPYSAAKWGVIGLMKTLAMELGPFGIRVNAICPGAVEGDRMERMLANEAAATGRNADDLRAGYTEGTSLGTWVTADDVADAALWLASTQARRVTGVVLPVDGHTERMR